LVQEEQFSLQLHLISPTVSKSIRCYNSRRGATKTDIIAIMIHVKEFWVLELTIVSHIFGERVDEGIPVECLVSIIAN